MGIQIDIDSKDGSGAFTGYLSVPSAGTGPGLILLQEILALTLRCARSRTTMPRRDMWFWCRICSGVKRRM